MTLKILDLFSGLGGFSLGLERTGHFKTIAFCDNDKYCNLVLQKHWKGVKIYNDVREITKEKLESDGVESPDIITGGFPCQPFSVAGKQKGTSDDRHLWPEMFRIIKAFKPRFVIGENVPGIVNIQDGVVFETVCTDLESQGYEVQPFNIPAAAVGAPHQRKRIWIIAILGDSEHNGSSTSEIERSFDKTSNNNEKRQNETSEFKRTSRSRNSKDVADTNNARDRTPEYETNENRQKINERRQEQPQLKSSRYGENVANANESVSRERQISRNLSDEGRGTSETGRESLQSEDRQTRTDNIGSSSEDVANTEQSRSFSESIRDIGSVGKESSRKEKGGNQSSIRTSTRSTEESYNVANAISRDVEAGRKRQRGIRKESQGQGTSSDVTSSSETVADTEGIESREQTQRQGWKNSTRGSFDIRRDSKKGSEEGKGWWHVEPNVGRVAHGVQGRVHRLKGLGNSIVPQIVEEIGYAIIKAEERK